MNMKLWKIKAAIKHGLYRIKYPVKRLHAWNWSPQDHAHVCVALRLLEKEDFEVVCPYNGKIDTDSIEICDECDRCKYMSIIDFNSNKTGKKSINIYLNDKVSRENHNE